MTSVAVGPYAFGASGLVHQLGGFVVTGSISRIVNSYGSKWGHVRPDREPRQVFFNADSLVEGIDFSSLALEDRVEFDEEADRANGLRAIRMRRVAAAPVATPAGEAVVQ